MKTTLRPEPLPYGSGSLRKRGKVFWMTYRNGAGVKVQENSSTDNPTLARAMLAERALLIAETKVADLKAILDEALEAAARELRAAAKAGLETRDTRKRRAGDRILPNRAPIMPAGKKAKSNGGKR